MDLIEVSDNQNRHPWELSRTAMVLNQLKKLKIHGNVLDIGCGDSYFDKRLLKEHPDLHIYGVDIYLENEMHNGNLHALNSLDHLPDIKFDYIIMMDVLEHIEDDKGYLKNVLMRLKKDGTVFITVPAFMSLYSLHDEELKHFRRYNHKQLGEVTKSAGLDEKRWSYFYFCLIPLRLLTKNKTENLSGWQKSEKEFSTRFVTWVLNTDFRFLNVLSRICLHIPGLSLLSVLKPGKDGED